jgi:hypothetical protein
MARTSRPAEPNPLEVSRIERNLAFMSLAIIALSALALFAVLLAPAFGRQDYTQGPWPAILVLPYVGLPTGLLLLLALLVVNGVRRARHARSSS